MGAHDGAPLASDSLAASDGLAESDSPVAVFCPRCGIPLEHGDHTVCRAALALEPPRYCPKCQMCIRDSPKEDLALLDDLKMPIKALTDTF